jgi:pSer/pThr/pTyr-binding forkhead associated (FHA) protein
MTAKALPPALRFVSPRELAERLEAERRGTPFLLYLDESRHQHIVELVPGQALTIGREPDSEVRLDWDSEVSRAHAMLERVGSAWTLIDDGLSRNGSFVNGRRVHGRRRLDDGDVIKVGRTLLAFVATAGAVRTTETAKSGTPPSISPAQQRVLDELCRPALDGPLGVPASNREIAEALFLSVETVKTHIHALFELFDVPAMPQNRKRAELVRQAFERGAISL